MKTFDYEQVNATLSPLRAKLKDCCAHGEGNACETLDKHLQCCAEICEQVYDAVTTWANGVFAGRIAFDPASESMWKAGLSDVCRHARRAWQSGKRAEIPCWDLPAQNRLANVLLYLEFLLNDWVTPKLSVAPSPRVKLNLDASQTAAIRRQLSALPAIQGAGAART